MPQPEMIAECWEAFAGGSCLRNHRISRSGTCDGVSTTAQWTMLGLMMTHRSEGPEVVAGRLDNRQHELREFQRRMGIDL